jgi:hypothetical protein
MEFKEAVITDSQFFSNYNLNNGSLTERNLSDPIRKREPASPHKQTTSSRNSKPLSQKALQGYHAPICPQN